MYRRRVLQLALAFSAAWGLAGLGLGAVALPSASALPGLTTGFANAPTLTSSLPSTVNRWLPKAKADGATLVRVPFEWRQIAPGRRHRGFVASRPGSRGYHWKRLDAEVKAITAHGLQPLLLAYLAPNWAQEGKPPRGVRPGSWRPDPKQFGYFAQALATRYSGHFRDPRDHRRFLPHVSFYQAWNEPNFSYNISPAWKKTRSGWVPESPNVYRPMLNAFYSGVKSVRSSDFVLAGGLAPYGDARPVGHDPKRWRVRPLAFYRGLFCLNKKLKKTCSSAVHLDGVDNHPYVFGPPTQPPYHSDDVDVADMYKVYRVLRAGRRAGTVLPAGHKQIWAGEISFASDPPLHTNLGLSLTRQARYTEQAMYLLWRQHVSTVMWLDIRDHALSRSTNPFFYGGLYFYSGAPKPAATAFRFPFVTHRVRSTRIVAWGRAPVGGKLRIERRAGTKWIVVARLTVKRHQVFQKKLRGRRGAEFRAQIGRNTSLVWS